MKGRHMLAALVGGLIITVGAEAHHSFMATYDDTQEVRIEGTLVAFHFRNPHASVDILAEDENGDSIRWTVEWGSASTLTGQGMTRESLRAGDHVVITGNVPRNAELRRLRMLSILRPADGYGWGFENESFD